MASFMTTVMTDVDKYWTKVWQGAGYTEPYVNVIYPGPGEAVFTPCANRMTTDDDAFTVAPTTPSSFPKSLPPKSGTVRSR